MRLFFSILILLSVGFLSVNADEKIITEDRFITVIDKQDMKFENFKNTTELTLKYEVEKINAVKDRVNDIGYAIDRFALLVTFVGVLITTIVFFFSFKSNAEARQTVADWLEENGDDYINKELQPIKENFNEMISSMKVEMEDLKKKSDLEIESLKGQLEERGNEVIESLSSKIIENDISDTELSIEDKQYFEHQIKGIKAKPIKKRILQDYTKMILFYIANKDYIKANQLVDKLIADIKYTKPEKGTLYYLKGFIQEKEGLYNDAIKSLNLSLDLNFSLVSAFNLKARIYNVVKQDYQKAMKLAKKVLEYDKDNYDAYIALGYGTRSKAYFEKNYKLYTDAILYNQKAIEINPDKDLAYNNIGSIYLIQEKYTEAKDWYIASFDINQNQWGYVNLLRIYFLLGEIFPRKLEKEYSKLFENEDTQQYTIYRMFKILENIVAKKYKNKKEISIEVNQWSSSTEKLRHYFFNILNVWVENIEDSEIKDNLIYTLKLFDNHRIK